MADLGSIGMNATAGATTPGSTSSGGASSMASTISRVLLIGGQTLQVRIPDQVAVNWPTYAVMLLEPSHRERMSAVDRSENEDGSVRQGRRQSRVLIKRPMQVKLTSFADYQSFITWFENDINYGTNWFNWQDPIDNQWKLARIVGGKLDKEEPVQGMINSFWRIGLTLETWNR